MAIYDRAIVRLLPAVPKPVVRRLSSRYIAGETLADASATVAALNAGGKAATVDVLGEEIRELEAAAAIAGAYTDVLAEIERAGLDANVSVKLTALGLKLDLGACRENLTRVVDDAAARGNFVRIDMEEAATIDATLGLYRGLREAGRDNVGVVLQASLRRTLGDVHALADLRPSVRVCKGIYVEAEELQYRDDEAVRANFVRATEALLEAGSRVAVATHDDWLLDRTKRLVDADGGDHEFQMLLGVRDDRADALVAEGRRLRVYVPFGRQWYEYSLRRLQENPSIAGYVAADTVGRLLGRRNGG